MKNKEVLKNYAKAKALIIQGLLYNHKQTFTLDCYGLKNC